jgi:hypothetical protein
VQVIFQASAREHELPDKTLSRAQTFYTWQASSTDLLLLRLLLLLQPLALPCTPP